MAPVLKTGWREPRGFESHYFLHYFIFFTAFGSFYFLLFYYMPAVILIIAINIGVFILPYLVKFGPTMSRSVNYFTNLIAKDNQAIDNGQWYRLLTSNYSHTDPVHILFNMYSLWSLGNATITIFRGSSVVFLAIYTLSGIGGSYLSKLLSPTNSIGASGAIFGLAGSLIAYAFMSRDYGMLSNLLFVIGINLLLPFLQPSLNIDNYGHLGGLIAGLVLGVGFYVWQR
jgi:rhomboid protease GluP